MTDGGHAQRAVFVCHSSLAVGVERTLVTLVRAAVDRGDHVEVVVPGPGPLVDLLAPWQGRIALRHRKAQWWMGPDHRGLRGAAKLAHAFSQIPSWERLFRAARADRVYVMSTVCPAPIAGARAGGADVVVFLSESVRTNPTLHSVIPKTAIVRRIRRWADVTVAVSEFAAAQWGGADLIEVPEVDGPAASVVERTASRSDAALRLVMLGTLSHEKGQRDAVRAVAAARAAGAPVTLDLYGDAAPAALAELGALVADLGVDDVVRHHGTTTDPLRVLAEADASVVCSFNEAYGRVTAESLLAGTPVLGYRLGGTAEILAAGGGALVDPTPEALAAAIVGLTRPDALAAVTAEARERGLSRDGFGDAAATLRAIDARLAR